MGAVLGKGCLALTLSVTLACAGYPAASPLVIPVLQQPLPPEVSLFQQSDPKVDPLAQVYDGTPRAGAHSLHDLGVRLRPNPCSAHVLVHEEAEEFHVTDLWPLTDSLFETLGFTPWTEVSTHLFVQVESTTVRTARAGEGYAECCAEASCGDGMVSAVHDGRLEAHPAAAMHASAPPMVLVSPQGNAVGLALHQGLVLDGAIALELTPTSDR